MALLDKARELLASALIADGAFTDFNNANARLGVGNGSDAFSSAHTGLQGGSTELKGMDASYPQRSTNVVTWRATFGTAEGNFAWEEVVVDNGTETLSRHVESLGTKTSAASWELTDTMTFVLA